METTPRPGARTTILALIALSFLPVLLVAFLYPDTRRGHTDFLSFYAGTQLVGTERLYSFDDAGRIQAQYGVPGQVRAYIRPPFYALLLYPLSMLPYSVGHVIWQALNVAALAGFIALWPRDRAFAAVLCCWFVPVLAALAGGQDAPILLLCCGLAFRFMRSGRPFVAGAILALCAAKFHLFLLVPLALVGTRQWRVVYGLLCGGAVLTVLSFVAGGRNWIAAYWAAAQHNEQILDYEAKMPNLLGLFHSVPYSAVWISIGVAAVAVCTWLVARRDSAEYGMAVMLAGGLLVGMHGFLYDCTFLAPLILVLADRCGNALALRLSAALSLLTITLTIPAISYIGQLTVIALFAYAVYVSLSRPARPSTDTVAETLAQSR